MGIFYQYLEDFLGIYNPDYYVIFQTLYDTGIYNLIGLMFIVIPLLMLLLFYFIWNYPYGKLWHWGLYLLIISVVVGFTTYSIVDDGIFNSNSQTLQNLMNNNIDGYRDFAYSLLLKYAILNASLAIVVSFLYSLLLKRYSKIQMHLPF